MMLTQELSLFARNPFPLARFKIKAMRIKVALSPWTLFTGSIISEKKYCHVNFLQAIILIMWINAFA